MFTPRGYLEISKAGVVAAEAAISAAQRQRLRWVSQVILFDL
jgi:hypothetical protein